MSQSNYLVIDGICNATACIQCMAQQCLIHISFYSTYPKACDIWMVDGISASHALLLTQQQNTQNLDVTLAMKQLTCAKVDPLRAGICMVSNGQVVAQGFPGGIHFPQLPFLEQKNAASLPPFSQHFGHPYDLDFSCTSLQQLAIHGQCKTLIENDIGVQHCCKTYGGCYVHLLQQAILLGIPWSPGKDPLPLLSLLPIQCYLPALQVKDFGCILLGVHPQKDQVFPIILQNN